MGIVAVARKIIRRDDKIPCGTAIKRAVGNTFDRRGQIKHCERLCAGKAVFGNGGEFFRKTDIPERGAVAEGALAYFGAAVGYVNRHKIRKAVHRPWHYFFHG